MNHIVVSSMTMAHDLFLRLADAVADVLAESDPLRSKEIARRLRLQGWGNPPINAVNKVLAQYLGGRVQRIGAGRWAAVKGSAVRK